jgi:hypothetical protein
MTAITKQSKRSLLNCLNNKLAKLDGLPLAEWLEQSKAIVTLEDGIYCGREGRTNEKVLGVEYDIWLTMGWYTVDKTPKVEFAYVS